MKWYSTPLCKVFAVIISSTAGKKLSSSGHYLLHLSDVNMHCFVNGNFINIHCIVSDSFVNIHCIVTILGIFTAL